MSPRRYTRLGSLGVCEAILCHIEQDGKEGNRNLRGKANCLEDKTEFWGLNYQKTKPEL